MARLSKIRETFLRGVREGEKRGSAKVIDALKLLIADFEEKYNAGVEDETDRRKD